MSRTFRCKNFEKTRGSSRHRQHDKIAGFYTRRCIIRVEDDQYYWHEVVFRAPTKEELHKARKGAHGESSHNNARSPNKWFRNRRMRENRLINKQELLKWINDDEYDPCFENNPRSCLWDWR